MMLYIKVNSNSFLYIDRNKIATKLVKGNQDFVPHQNCRKNAPYLIPWGQVLCLSDQVLLFHIACMLRVQQWLILLLNPVCDHVSQLVPFLRQAQQSAFNLNSHQVRLITKFGTSSM